MIPSICVDCLTRCFIWFVKANFVVNDVEHKQYILGSLGKKWKDKRCRLFDKFHNWEQSVEENIQNYPPHIPQYHWAIFVRYKRSAKTMEIANKNAANRAKLVIPHSLVSKTLARKRNELEVMHGWEFSRAEMYQVSHKKPDGSFVNEEARELHGIPAGLAAVLAGLTKAFQALQEEMKWLKEKRENDVEELAILCRENVELRSLNMTWAPSADEASLTDIKSETELEDNQNEYQGRRNSAKVCADAGIN
ncbi:hypothetical protein Fmac_015216 [Flemingia macrophylla]|uniref:Uncharacterized protein n=1 Tax=Flemingia macrophylla TaxID=520843 RepID=A0ABD1MDY4_9FABA